MLVRRHVLVKGLVQGVFFRAKVQDLAEKLKITGWARNTSDGNVEAVFEGETNSIEKIVNFCKKGPAGSKVEGLDVKGEKYTGEFKDFKIIYQE